MRYLNGLVGVNGDDRDADTGCFLDVLLSVYVLFQHVEQQCALVGSRLGEVGEQGWHRVRCIGRGSRAVYLSELIVNWLKRPVAEYHPRQEQ